MMMNSTDSSTHVMFNTIPAQMDNLISLNDLNVLYNMNRSSPLRYLLSHFTERAMSENPCEIVTQHRPREPAGTSILTWSSRNTSSMKLYQ
jgi:hypothetical protein